MLVDNTRHAYATRGWSPIDSDSYHASGENFDEPVSLLIKLICSCMQRRQLAW